MNNEFQDHMGDSATTSAYTTSCSTTKESYNTSCSTTKESQKSRESRTEPSSETHNSSNSSSSAEETPEECDTTGSFDSALGSSYIDHMEHHNNGNNGLSSYLHDVNYRIPPPEG